ncbi:MAG TPA: hypothetical protein VK816_07710, partial [Jatrophihabitantaceae bacterium]|nr:hypothetical protein [Jatrophihabitantaceae bacterium]
MKPAVRLTLGCLLSGLLVAALPGNALAAPAPPAPSAPGTAGVASVPTDRREAVLGKAWASSSDQLWSLVPTPAGLSVLNAPIASGGSWSPVASLSVSGIDSHHWIGQGCILRGSHVVAVAFGPVEYISTASLFERGAFAALVDLDTGAVDYLPHLRPSFAYFSPQCGADRTAAFTSYA